MQTISMSADGRVVIPKRIREELGWVHGVILHVEVVGEGVKLRNLKPEDL